MVGVGGPVVPPRVTVPVPLKLRVMVAPTDPVPVRVGKDPVAPAKFPVPLVTVAEPVRGPPVNADGGTFTVPRMVPGPPVALGNVMVKGTLKFPDESGVREIVAAMVPLTVLPPLPRFVRLAGPETEMVAPMLPVAFTVNVVVTACAPTLSSRARPEIENRRFISL